MSATKDSLQKDGIQKLKRETNKNTNTKIKVEALSQEINCLQFFPSTNIVIDPSIDTGNLHYHLFKVVEKTLAEYAKRGEIDPIEATFLLPAAAFAMTGIANCEGLSIYAVYRWLIEADLSNPKDLPMLINFIGYESDEAKEKIFHHAFAVGLNFNLEQYKLGMLELEDKKGFNLIDFWLKEKDPKTVIAAIMRKFPKIQNIDFCLPLEINASVTRLLEIRKQLPERFNLVCEKFRKIYVETLAKSVMPTKENCDLQDTGWYRPKNSNTLLQPKFIIDPIKAYLHLKRCYLERQKGIGSELGVLPNIRLIFEYLIKNTPAKFAGLYFQESSLSFVKEIAAKYFVPTTKQSFGTAKWILSWFRCSKCCNRNASLPLSRSSITRPR